MRDYGTGLKEAEYK
jgi:Ca2+-binding EF-hand superfamily protein